MQHLPVVCCLAHSSLMMEAVRTFETLVDNNFTRQYIPEDNSEHHTRRRENLKSHNCWLHYSIDYTFTKQVKSESQYSFFHCLYHKQSNRAMQEALKLNITLK
jgi:hypothetical protein